MRLERSARTLAASTSSLVPVEPGDMPCAYDPFRFHFSVVAGG